MQSDKTYQLRTKRIYFALIILSLPIIAYAYQFGVGLWDTHEQWAEMGSALGGIYAPILSIFTFLLLFGQFNIQTDLAKHTYDTEMINKSTEHILKNLEKVNSIFQLRMKDDKSENMYDLMSIGSGDKKLNFQDLHPNIIKIMPNWASITSTLSSLKQPNEVQYMLAYNQLKQQIINEFNVFTCGGLDGFLVGKGYSEEHCHFISDLVYFKKSSN